MRDLDEDALVGVFWDALTGHSDGSGRPKATPREGVVAVRNAVLAALAEAAGSPEALANIEAHAALDADMNGANVVEAALVGVQAVAAAVVARMESDQFLADLSGQIEERVRTAEVLPLRALLKRGIEESAADNREGLARWRLDVIEEMGDGQVG